VLSWIQQQSQRTLWEVIDYVEQEYQVLYRSLESYYTLLKEAGMSWHKGKKKAPNTMSLWCKSAPKQSMTG